MAQDPAAPSSPRRQALIALAVFLAVTLLIALANVFAAIAHDEDTSPWMAASGIALAFVAIPIFAVIVPLWLARRWALPRS